MTLEDTGLKRLFPFVRFMLVVLILMPAPSTPMQQNCSQPNQPALLDALNPVFNLSAIRPVMSLTTCTNITTYFTLYGILGVDEKAQLLNTYIWLEYWWTNEFISWDPVQCGTNKIALPKEKFWVPDIVINEFMDDNTAPAVPFMYLSSDGTVYDTLPVKVVSSCKLDIYNFPFDVQTCNLSFNSYLLSARDIKIFLGSPADNITEYSKEVMATMGEWELLDITAEKPPHPDEDESDYIDMLVFHITVRRRPTMYVVNLLLPSCFLITVDLFSFLLPPQAVDRSAFKMTLILGYTVFLLIMNDLLPITGNTIPLINVFFSLCLALMVASLLETILVTSLLCGSARFSPVPRWVRVLVLQVLGRLVCLPHKQKDSDSELGAVKAKSESEEEPPEEKGPAAMDRAVEELRSLGRDLQAVRQHVEQQLGRDQKAEDWNQVGFIIDRLLFALYVLFISVSFITIIIIWRCPVIVRPSTLLYVLICVLTHDPGSAVVLNCTHPTSVSLLKALQPVFELNPIRPVHNISTVTSVRVTFTLYGILGVDEKEQILTTFIWQRISWKNEFIAWDPDQCGSGWITVPRKLLWAPDVIISEFVGKNSAPFVPYDYIFSDGTVVDAQPVKVVSSCKLDIYAFPFDIQNCSFTFSSFLFRDNAIKLDNMSSAEDILKNSLKQLTAMGEWDLIGITLRKYVVPAGAGERTQRLRFFVSLRRQAVTYVVNLLLPSCLLITVDLCSSLLPPEAVHRSSFKVTLILGYTVFLLIVNNLLPITGNTIPLINVFLSLCLSLMLASLLETIIITDLMCGPADPPLPPWVHLLVLRVLGRLVLLPPKPRDADAAVVQSPHTQESKNSSSASEREDEALEELRSLSGHLQAIRLQLQRQTLSEAQSSGERVQVGLVIDRLLFCLYILFVSVSFVTIIAIWVQSHNSTS